LYFFGEELLMKLLSYLVAAILAGVSVGAAHASPNLLANPSFEAPITFDGAPFVGSWEGFSGGGATTANGSSSPHSGTMEADLGITGINSFAGVFQDVPVAGGATVTFSGFHKAATSPLNIGTEIRIEWRDATSEVGRTPNLTPVATASYTPFTLVANAPPTAIFARVVYDIQSFSTAPLGSGAVFADDFSVTVPEPASICLLGLGMFGLIGFARAHRRA
jgi:PEP-CTERM motif